MTPVQICKTWAWGIYLGSSVYLGDASFHITKHPVGNGIWVGALAVMISFWIWEK